VFRDRHLLTMLGLIASIHVIGQDDFTLQWETNNLWRVLPPQNFPADQLMATRLARTLSDLQAASSDDTASAADAESPRYGFKQPARQFVISWTPSAKATNPPTKLDFGTGTNGQIFARRMGEFPLYEIAPADYEALPTASWEMRDRRIWNFEVNEVVRLTIQQDGKTREIVHNGTNGWGIPPGSTGNINDSAIEDTMNLLAHLKAFSWLGHGADKLAGCGIDAKAYQLTIELKNGQKLAFQLGKETRLGSACASVMLDGEPWIFEFPPDVLPSVVYALTIPSS
jgi:hypothetical protein